ncbi:MAG: arsenic transporter [Hyphomicrobiales bacterium]|nr:arsenic transporter [Hyphomicrobiales bacterium]
MPGSQIASLAIATTAVLGVVSKPWRSAEYMWAVGGAVLLVLFGLLPFPEAVSAVAKGTDVYLFLVGMMLLAEVARQQGLFDFLANLAVRWARGSATRLFAMVYVVGIIVTAFLSNDATAVVLTPAVYRAARYAKVEPLPYLLACAFVANAASFVLPISNPGNLVIFGSLMPSLPIWLLHLGLPAIVAMATTFGLLYLTQRRQLTKPSLASVPTPLSRGGRLAAAGIVLTAVVLLATSIVGMDLGLPTFIAGVVVTAAVLLLARKSPLPVLKDVSWGVLPLVAGLFVLVQSVEYSGLLQGLTVLLQNDAARAPALTASGAGVIAAFGSNIINNLAMGLLAAAASHGAQVPLQVTEALTVGVDLGPNLSVTGSLATILWLVAVRREGVNVSAWAFLKLGLVVMPPALLLSLAALLLVSH